MGGGGLPAHAEVYDTLILSLNPAIDRFLSLERFEAGGVYRTANFYYQAGGKSVNVARALTALGHKVYVLGLAGGHNGSMIRSELASEGIESRFLHIEGESRTCYVVLDRTQRVQTVINESGPEISTAEYEALWSEFEQALPHSRLLICSGSIPRGAPADCYARFTEAAHQANIETFVDVSGEPLQHALSAHPYLIKPNLDEAQELLGRSLSLETALEAALEILSRGVRIGIVTLAEAGAVAAWQGGRRLFPAPKVEVVNAVGSGDAFVAGCAAAYLAGRSHEEMVRYGVAAGTANATVGGGRINPMLVEQLYDGMSPSVE